MNLIYPVFVINLKKDIERLTAMNTLMDGYGLAYNRFEAISGKNMKDAEIEKYVNPFCSKLFCNNGIIGCAMSHYMLWKQLCDDDNNENYIIFEDDITEIKVEYLSKICTYIDKENFQFDFINLYCAGYLCQQNEIIKIDNTIGLCYTPFPLGMVGYIISKQGAQQMIKIIEKYKIINHIDQMIAYYKVFADDFRYFTTNPNIVEHNFDISSTIQDNTTNITIGFVGCLFGKKYARDLTTRAFVINRKYEISVYVILMAILLSANYYFIKSSLLLYYILIDLTIYFIQILSKN